MRWLSVGRVGSERPVAPDTVDNAGGTVTEPLLGLRCRTPSKGSCTRSPRAAHDAAAPTRSSARARAAVHSVKSPCAVGPDGARTGGNCRQAQPDVATKMIAAGGVASRTRADLRPGPSRNRRDRPLEQLSQLVRHHALNHHHTVRTTQHAT